MSCAISKTNLLSLMGAVLQLQLHFTARRRNVLVVCAQYVVMSSNVIQHTVLRSVTCVVTQCVKLISNQMNFIQRKRDNGVPTVGNCFQSPVN